MDKCIKKLIERLYDNVLKNNFIEIAYEVTDELMKSDKAFEAIDPIIILFESNPNVDFGNPGPLVHFLEKFDEEQYNENLIESIQIQPTRHTLLMLNRIINSMETDRKSTFVSIFDIVINSKNSSDDAKKAAREFKALHTNSGVDN